MAAASLAADSNSGNFLVSPNLGVMIWTLIAFVVTMLLLWKLAFPYITRALDKRQHDIEQSIDAARSEREEAARLLAEYRERLREARTQADEIMARARHTATEHEHESEEQARARASELVARAERDIDAATRRALQEIRGEVANLTVLATEKVTKKVLDDADQRRLVTEALEELDFSGLAGSARE